MTVPSYSIEQACKNYGADKKIITIVYVENSKELANNGNNTLTDSSLQIEDKSENKTKEEKQQEKYKKEDLKWLGFELQRTKNVIESTAN